MKEGGLRRAEEDNFTVVRTPVKRLCQASPWREHVSERAPSAGPPPSALHSGPGKIFITKAESGCNVHFAAHFARFRVHTCPREAALGAPGGRAACSFA